MFSLHTERCQERTGSSGQGFHTSNRPDFSDIGASIILRGGMTCRSCWLGLGFLCYALLCSKKLCHPIAALLFASMSSSKEAVFLFHDSDLKYSYSKCTFKIQIITKFFTVETLIRGYFSISTIVIYIHQ